MAQWQKTQIQRDNGMMAEAQAPIIISASRSTDIPAFMLVGLRYFYSSIYNSKPKFVILQT